MPLWVKRIIGQVFTALKEQGIYFFHIDDDVLEVDRDNNIIYCICLRNRVKICSRLPSETTVKVIIYHYPNRPALVKTQGITLRLNRYIKIRRIN